MTKLCIISDTHQLHREIELPTEEMDFLLHAGDFTNFGDLNAVQDFANWLSEQKQFKHKLCIAGNHDVSAAGVNNHKIRKIFDEAGVIYLQDSGIELEGLKFWGSPASPSFSPKFNAFTYNRGKDIKAIWDQVPSDINVLISHSPCHGYLDEVDRGPAKWAHAGCEDLLNRIWELKNLKLIVSGHLHQSNQKYMEVEGLKFVNGAQLNDWHEIVYIPIIVEL